MNIILSLKHIFWILGFFLLTPIMLFSQFNSIGIPEIKNFLKSDYNGSTQNWAIDQDQNSNLYFANNNGLLQYDGSNWTKHLLPNNNSVRSLKISKKGKIYIGSFNEFGFFETNTKGGLVYHSLSKFLAKEKISTIDFIWKIHQVGDEIIFQSFEYLYIYSTNKITQIPAPNKFQFSFLVDKKLFVQDNKLGILLYSNGKLIKLPNTESFNNTEIWGVFSASDSKKIIATIDKGMFEYENNRVQIWKCEANDFVKKNNALGGVKLPNGFLVLNSVLDGSIICNIKGEIVQHINQKKGIQNNTVLTSFVDNRNNIWLGLDNGIAFLNANSSFTNFGSNYNISSVYASTIFNEKLYVATNQGLFARPIYASFKTNNFQLVAGTTGQAWNIQVIHNTLVCSHNRGAFIINKDDTINAIDSQGYWGFKTIPNKPNWAIASNYNGFSVFEKIGNEFIFKHQIKGILNSINFFEIDQSNIWYIKDAMIYQLQYSDDLKYIKKIQKYANLSSLDKGITSIQSIEKQILFQTNNQFYTFSNQKNKFIKSKKFNTLFEKKPKIKQLKEDSNGNLWFTHDESLGMLMKAKETFKDKSLLFSNLTGNLVSNYLSVTALNSTSYYIGLTDGLTLYEYNETTIKAKPTAYIRSFSFANETFISGNVGAKFGEINIPYQHNNVKFTFSAPIFENKKILFSYQLIGFDSKWSSWSSENLKEYTNLREGNYTMKVRSKNSFELVSNSATVAFSVTPPWYRSIVAYFLYLIGFGIIIHLVRLQVQAKIRRNKYFETIEQRKIYLEKESKIKQEQYELEKEIEKLKNEKLKSKIISKDKELVNNSLQVAKKNKILNGIITKVKEIDSEAFDEITKVKFNKLHKSIEKEVNSDRNWNELEKHIQNVHFDFLLRLKVRFPSISPRELDLSTYLLMNMSTKEIAEIMNISGPGVELARYRLRKKIGLKRDENLVGFLMSI